MTTIKVRLEDNPFEYGMCPLRAQDSCRISPSIKECPRYGMDDERNITHFIAPFMCPLRSGPVTIVGE